MAASNPLLDPAAKLWNALGTPLRRGLAWVVHAKFVHGVSGVIVNEDGNVLLLKHRFWKHQRWGLPGGFALHGETLAATLRRELIEETGLEVHPTMLIRVNTARGSHAQFVLLAYCNGTPEPRSPEILEARFWPLTSLPDNLLVEHRALLEKTPPAHQWPGVPLDR